MSTDNGDTSEPVQEGDFLVGPVTLDLGFDYRSFLITDLSEVRAEHPEVLEALQTNPALADVILPKPGSSIRLHSTSLDSAEAILATGLASPAGITETTAVLFDNVNELVEGDFGYMNNPFLTESDEVIATTNTWHIVVPRHRGHVIKVVLDLPAVNAADLEKATTEGVPPGHLYSEQIPIEKRSEYGSKEFIIPPKYIRGYIDLTNGKFTANPMFEQS